MNKLSRFLGTALLAAVLPASPVLANKANDTVHISFTKELDNADVYFSALREAMVFGYNVFDPLIERDAKTGAWVGNLAESFKWVNDTTLEFKLRHGVKFHNGEPFDADDVVFTFNHFSDPKTAVATPSAVDWIKKAEKIDQYTVRVYLKKPFPAALDYVQTSLPIYPHQYYEKVGEQGFAQKPIGTGPYEVVSIEPGHGYTLKAYKNYHAGGPRHKARIENVEVRSIPDVNTEIAELFSGSTDFMWRVPEEQARKIAAQNKFSVVEAPTMRFGFISLDAAGRTAGKVPMTDIRVRQAINYAIDRKAIRDAFFSPESKLINSVCNPLQFGCEQDVKAYNYDPQQAKKLLSEAGYPHGFSTTLYFYSGQEAAQAMAQMLADVGIKAKLATLKLAALEEKKLQGKVPMGFFTWGSGSVPDVSASTSKFFDGSAIDYARNPQLTALLKAGDTTTDAKVRKENYSKALKLIADEAYWVPLWTYTVNYVMSPALDYKPTPDEIVRFFDMSWK